MKIQLFKLALPLLIAGIHGTQALADAGPPCDTPSPNCPASKYKAYFPQSCPPPTLTTTEAKCLEPQASPAPATMACSPFAGGVFCDAWPKAQGILTYAWTKTALLHLDYTPDAYDSSIYFNCNYGASGTVTVRVIAPDLVHSATTSEYTICGDL